MQKTTATTAPDEFAALLRKALAQLRTIRAAPPPDDTKAKLLIALDQIFKLRPAEGRMLAALLERKSISREAMCAAITRNVRPVSIKVVSVTLGGLRKRLEPFGVDVVTVWARGFRLTESGRSEINRLLAEHGAGVVPRAEPASVSPD